MEQFTPAEIAIVKAMEEVERAGADLSLTNAIIHLQQAKEFVSDFVDEVLRKREEGHFSQHTTGRIAREE